MLDERYPNLRHPSGFLRLYFLGPKNEAGRVPSLSCGFFNLPKFLGALEMCGKMMDIFMFLLRVCASGSRSFSPQQIPTPLPGTQSEYSCLQFPW